MKKHIWIPLLLAFLIRLISLNQSLWLDEATTARVVQQLSYLQIITQFSPTDFHPPLFYLFMKLWTSIFGYSETALRMPSVILSVATGWVVYRISTVILSANVDKVEKSKSLRVQELKEGPNHKESLNLQFVSNFDIRASNFGLSWFAMIFFLFNPLVVYYSQEARMYMMVTFMLTFALYAMVKLLGQGSFTGKKLDIGNWILGGKKIGHQFIFIMLFNLTVFLSFLTFYGSIFFIVTMYVYLLITKKWRLLLVLLPGFVLALAVVAPLLSHQLTNSRIALQQVTNWRQVLGVLDVKNVVLFPIKFTSGRISFTPKIAYFAAAGVWSMIVMFFVAIGGWKRKDLAMLFVLPIVFGMGFSIFSPLMQYFRFLYLIPVMSVLLAVGVERCWMLVSGYWLKGTLKLETGNWKLGKNVTLLLNGCIFVGFVIFSSAYLLLPQFHREDWKGLSAQLSASVPVYMILPSCDPVRYYRSDLVLRDIRTIATSRFNTNIWDVPTAVPQEDTIAVIPYVVSLYGFEYKGWLSSHGFVLKEKQVFRGIELEKWEKNTVMVRK